MSVYRTPNSYSEQCLLPMQRLADAPRVLEMNLDGNPFVGPAERHEIRLAKRAAWQVLADVAEQLVATLDIAAGDPDLEDATDLEDETLSPSALRYARSGPGCDVADTGEDEGDREGIGEREAEDGV